MKKIFPLLIVFFVMTSCSKDDDPVPITPTEVSNTLVSGTWRVTYFWDSNKDETNDFNGYAFTFSAGGVVTAVRSGSTVTGSWSTGQDDSKTELLLSFSSPADFVELSDDWEVVEQTSTRIKLRDVSGGNGGTDQLVFERN